jgi:hypothetical protein
LRRPLAGRKRIDASPTRPLSEEVDAAALKALVREAIVLNGSVKSNQKKAKR